MSMYNRATIHTSLYSPEACSLIKMLKTEFRNTWNSRSMRITCERFEKVEHAPDGEVIIPPTEYWNEGRIWTKSNNDVLKWIAIHLKHVVKDDYVWSRVNDDVVKCLSNDEFKVTVSEAYLVYDIFLQRKNIEMKYPKSLVAKWRGKQRDPISTELEIARRQEIEDIKANAEKLIADHRETANDEIQKFREKIYTEHDEFAKKVNAERDEKIKKLNDSMTPVNGLTKIDEESEECESLAS